MNFLNPLLLAGLLAAGLPIVIHLMNRRRAVRRRFPAMEFLLRSQKKLARRLKVRQLLLLALRVAALLFLPLAMARPYLISDSGTTAADRLPQGVVFVVDDSASMAYEGTWERTLEAVDERLDGLRTWDRTGLVFAGAWPGGAPLGEEAGILELTDDPGEVRNALESHGPSERATDLVAGLRAAADVLANADLPRKRIILVTDRQNTGFDPQSLPPGGFGADIEILDVHPETETTPKNIAITEADTVQKSAGARPEFEIGATIANYGATDVSGVEVQLLIDDTMIAAGLVDIPAGKTARKSFVHQFQSKGLHRAELRLGKNTDKLTADNVRYLPIQLAQKVRVLLVNGDPRSVPYQDELFYLERALRPSKRSTSTIITEVTAVEGLASHPFNDHDVIVLANVEKIPRASAAELRAFVKAGGGLLFVAGPLVAPESWNALFGDLLPKPLRSVKRLAARDDPDAPVKVVRFGRVDRAHPIFKVFDLPGGETVHSVPVHSYMLLEPTPTDDARILLSYGDGAPALLEKTFGEGRTAMLTTTIDRDWTDFPIRTAFLPITRRAIYHLARRGTSSQGSNHQPGARFSLETQPQDRGRVEVRDPDGGRIILTPESAEEGAPLTFTPRRTGHYRVVVTSERPGTEPKDLDELAFAVNIDPREANLAPISLEELQKVLQNGTGDPNTAGAVTVDAPEKRVGVWSILLFLVTLVLLAETILGTRRSVMLRIWHRIQDRKPEDLL